MHQGGMTIGNLIASAFGAARARTGNLAERWVAVSFRIGGAIPNSLLSLSVQRCGELDCLLRCMEDEKAKAGSGENPLAFHYQAMLSELWVGSIYEILRLLDERGMRPAGDEFDRLHHEFRVLRIPLEKHELALDRSLKAPLPMQRNPGPNPRPENSETPPLYFYPDKKDPGYAKRAHIMQSGVSERGSMMWQVTDLKSSDSYWLERRELSERFLALWATKS
jgi:hypothetical protein